MADKTPFPVEAELQAMEARTADLHAKLFELGEEFESSRRLGQLLEDLRALVAGVRTLQANQAAGEAALKAVRHVLNRRQLNPDLGYYIGYGTESFDLLCAAEALVTGEPVEVVQERRSQDMQPTYRKVKRRELQLEERIAALERELEAARGS